MKKGDRVQEIDPQHDGCLGTITSVRRGNDKIVRVRWDVTKYVSSVKASAVRLVVEK